MTHLYGVRPSQKPTGHSGQKYRNPQSANGPRKLVDVVGLKRGLATDDQDRSLRHSNQFHRSGDRTAVKIR